MRSAGGARLAVPDWLSEAVPDWLADVLRPKKAAVPWAEMARAVLAIWVPLAVEFIAGHRSLGLLPAMGGLMSVMIDRGGAFRARVRRVGTAAVLGGAVGLTVGSVIHGRGWVAVAAVVAVAGVSSLWSRLGGIGSVTGLQLLMYSALGLGPLGALRPWWHTALGWLAGVVWALLLITPGWLLSPRGVERRLVADVYHALADDLRAVGTPGAAAARQAVTAALNAAYDALLTGRSASSGRSRGSMHLMAILNVSHQLAEAASALRHAGEQPPPWVSDTVDRLADAVSASPGRALGRRPAVTVPIIPPQWSASPGALALRDSMVSLSRVISGTWSPLAAAPLAAAPQAAAPQAAAPLAGWRLPGRLRGALGYLSGQVVGGRIAWTYTIRLMVCTGVAAVVSETAPLQRSYWVVLTVAIILKPDYGSVFARALQRGAGTVLGAAGGAAILAVVPYGPWLLLPLGILAALLPYGQARSFGLSATFLTPLVVVLIDLLTPTGWRLAGDRAIDTLLASAIVLVTGYAAWPVSWQAHLPGQFAGTVRAVCAYMEESLVTAWSGNPPPGTDQAGSRPAPRSRLRRQAFRSLSDLRAEFQRTMSEPAAASRRATGWYPALVGLEELLDAVTTTSLAISRGAPPPPPKCVHQLTGALCAVADAVEAGIPAVAGPLPAAGELRPVTDAVRSVLAVLAPASDAGGRQQEQATEETPPSVR